MRNRNATEEDAIAITSGNKSPAANPSAGRKSERGKMTSESKTKLEFRVATESIKAPRAAAELHIQGRWSVTVELNNGKRVHEWGEFCELDVPNKVVMTRRFGGHPLLGERETTLTYQLEPSPHGTPVTVRLEGFIGRSEAANGSRSGSSTLVKDQIPLRALSGSSACQAVRLAGAQAYAMKPPKAMTRIPVRRTRPDPCCNHQSMMA